jgi:hypothetical protein
MSEEKSVVYDLQTSWRDLHVPTFVAVSSAVYFGEQLIGHPVEVVRTRLQVSQKVCGKYFPAFCRDFTFHVFIILMLC